MGKRKRSTSSKSTANQDEAQVDAGATDEAVKEDMAHVSPDLLAGSPDVFAAKPADESTEEPTPVLAEAEPVASDMTETVTESKPEGVAVAVSEPIVAVSEPEAAPAQPAVVVPPSPPSQPAGAPGPARKRPGNSSLALGVVLVVVGIFALAVAVSGIDLTQYGWPLFVIVPGLTLLVVGFVGGGAAASIPGGIITMFGLVLAYASSSGDWASWAFAWSAVAPFGVGLGMYLQALRDRDPVALRRGRALLFIGSVLFIAGFVIFESILNISNRDYGLLGKAALPLLLIAFGTILLIRSARHSSKA